MTEAEQQLVMDKTGLAPLMFPLERGDCYLLTLMLPIELANH